EGGELRLECLNRLLRLDDGPPEHAQRLGRFPERALLVDLPLDQLDVFLGGGGGAVDPLQGFLEAGRVAAHCSLLLGDVVAAALQARPQLLDRTLPLAKLGELRFELTELPLRLARRAAGSGDVGLMLSNAGSQRGDDDFGLVIAERASTGWACLVEVLMFETRCEFPRPIPLLRQGCN